MKVVASILTGRDEALPMALFDSDGTGKQAAQQLATSLYADANDRILGVESFTGIRGSEIEDLIPPELVAQVVDRWQRGPEKAFADSIVVGKPIVPQIEEWAISNKIELTAPAWKVELAKRVKQAMLARNAKPTPPEFVERWETLFHALLN